MALDSQANLSQTFPLVSNFFVRKIHFLFIMEAFIAAIPKLELHVHLEGTLQPDLMFQLAQENQIELPFSSIQEVLEAYSKLTDLKSFLELYYQGMKVLRKEEDFYRLTMAYL